MALDGKECVDVPRSGPAEDAQVGDATLLGLPVELQNMILEYCTTNADKKNVCATSKALQALMTPLLYRRMELSAPQLNSRFSRTLAAAATHPGLPHVRTISIRHLWDTVQLNVLCRLIFALPKNVLTRFEIPTCYLYHIGLHGAIHLRQRKITNYQYGGIHSLYRDKAKSLEWRNLVPSEDRLARITSLQFLIASTDDIERVAWVLGHSPALQRLDLEESSAYHDSHLTCCEADAEIFKGIFSSGGTARYPARLKNLRIAYMCLEQSGGLLPSLLNFEALETLQLASCAETDSLLEHLTQLRLHLSSICIDRGSDGPSDRAGISAFVASLAAPKHLSFLCEVDYPYDGQIDVCCLQEHSQSIEYLRLEDSNATWLTYESSDQAPQFRSFFEQAFSLKQLSLSGPDLEDENEVAEFLDIIKPLTALRILKTQMFFVDDDTPRRSDLNIAYASRLVEQIANKIFNTAFPQLAAVVLKVSGLPSQIFEDKTFAFLRSEQIGREGEKIFVAVKVEPHMVRHHVACADILEEERFVFA